MRISDKPTFRSVLHNVLSPMRRARDNGDGYPAYVAAATRARMDVNDWIEAKLGWMPALPVLESLVFPYLRNDSAVCEVGVGTGRWSRHLLKHVPFGGLVLVDKSQWIVDFTREYFDHAPNVRSILCDGFTIPTEDNKFDVVFSQGMFITLKLGHVFLYMKEFARVLKPGGRAIFDFIDPETPSGWEFLQREVSRAPDVFAYHALPAVSRCLGVAGLEIEHTFTFGKSTYLVTRSG